MESRDRPSLPVCFVNLVEFFRTRFSTSHAPCVRLCYCGSKQMTGFGAMLMLNFWFKSGPDSRCKCTSLHPARAELSAGLHPGCRVNQWLWCDGCRKQTNESAEEEQELSDVFMKTLNYCQRFSKFKNRETMTAVRKWVHTFFSFFFFCPITCLLLDTKTKQLLSCPPPLSPTIPSVPDTPLKKEGMHMFPPQTYQTNPCRFMYHA